MCFGINSRLSTTLLCQSFASPARPHFLPCIQKVGKNISRCWKIPKILVAGLPRLNSALWGPQTVDGPSRPAHLDLLTQFYKGSKKICSHAKGAVPFTEMLPYLAKLKPRLGTRSVSMASKWFVSSPLFETSCKRASQGNASASPQRWLFGYFFRGRQKVTPTAGNTWVKGEHWLVLMLTCLALLKAPNYMQPRARVLMCYSRKMWQVLGALMLEHDFASSSKLKAAVSVVYLLV